MHLLGWVTEILNRLVETKVETYYTNYVNNVISKKIVPLQVLAVIYLVTYYILSMTRFEEFKMSTPQIVITVAFAAQLLIAIMSTLCFRYVPAFLDYLEVGVVFISSFYALMSVSFADIYRVAILFGYDLPFSRWEFHDGAITLWLATIIAGTAIYLPIRVICLWPICLSALLGFLASSVLLVDQRRMGNTLGSFILLVLISVIITMGKSELDRNNRKKFVDLLVRKQNRQTIERKAVKTLVNKIPRNLEELMVILSESIEIIDILRFDTKFLTPSTTEALTLVSSNLVLCEEAVAKFDSLNKVEELYEKQGVVDDDTREFIRENFKELQPPTLYDKTQFLVPIKYIQTFISSLMLETSKISFKAAGSFNLAVGIGTIWNLNMSIIDTESKGNACVTVGSTVLAPFTDERTKLNHFLTQIQNYYVKTNPYHSHIHGAEVCHSALFLVRTMNVLELLETHESLAVLVASLCHDVGHPARSNVFQIATNSKLALRYNDVSILENFHAATTFQILLQPDCNFLSRMPQDQYRIFRKCAIELILETDMAKHFTSISKFKVRRSLLGFDILGNKDDRWETVKMCMKAADIGHSSKQWSQHYCWSTLCIEEFHLQGDSEKSRGLPISPLCDRAKQDVDKCQKGFLEFVALELFEELHQVELTVCNDEPPKYYSEGNDIRCGHRVPHSCCLNWNPRQLARAQVYIAGVEGSESHSKTTIGSLCIRHLLGNVKGWSEFFLCAEFSSL